MHLGMHGEVMEEKPYNSMFIFLWSGFVNLSYCLFPPFFSIFEKQIGTPISATTSYIHFEGSTTFSDNTGARTGGAISLLDDSLVDVAEVRRDQYLASSI